MQVIVICTHGYSFLYGYHPFLYSTYHFACHVAQSIISIIAVCGTTKVRSVVQIIVINGKRCHQYGNCSRGVYPKNGFVGNKLSLPFQIIHENLTSNRSRSNILTIPLPSLHLMKPLITIRDVFTFEYYSLVESFATIIIVVN